MKPRYFRFPCLAVVFLCLTVSALAQVSVSTGAIRGTVTDPNGGVVIGATVVLTNPSLGVSKETRTESDGTFIFSLVQPGSGYQVEIRADGFQRQVLSDLVVRVTEVTAAGAKLEVGGVNQQVVVKGETQHVQTDSATLGGVLTSQVIVELPLNTRNPLELLSTDAGVVATPGSTTLYVTGSRSTFNNFTLNGVDANNFEFGSLDVVPTPNPDTIQEFRTQTSMYDATMGRGSGANITLITKSGTSKLHGNAYEFNRSNSLAANDFFANAANQGNPFFLRNDFGASLGGPFPGGKTFWFINYEGTRQRNASTLTTITPVLPDVRTAGTLAAAFGLPVSAIDPVAVKILNLSGPFGGKLVPSGQGVLGGFGNFSYNTTVPFDTDQGSFKVDRDFVIGGQSNHLTASALFEDDDSSSPYGGSGFGFNNGSTFHYSFRNYAITDTHTFSPNWINELTVGASITIVDGNNHANGHSISEIGMSRFNQSIFNELPWLYFADMPTVGPNPNLDPHQHTPTVDLRDMVIHNFGRHTIRMGGEARWHQFNYYQPYLANGFLYFGGFVAASLYGPSPVGGPEGIRDFLVGAPFESQVASGISDFGFRANDYIGFVTDDFRVTRRLTLNLGLRYDYLGDVYEKRNHFANYDPSRVPSSAAQYGGPGLLDGVVVPASFPGFGTPGTPDSLINSNNKHNFAPRVGFGLDVLGNGKLALRGGFGIFYNRLSAIPALQLSGQAPFDISTFTQNFSQTQLLSNPFPTLPLPNQFPIMPTAPTLTGLASDGSPIFSAPQLSATGFQPNLKVPYVEEWNLTTQYEFLPKWIAEVGYSGSHGIHLYNTQNLNEALYRNSSNPGPFGLDTNSAANLFARVPVVGFSGISVITSSGQSSYNALLTTVSHQFDHGLYLKVAYTFSKSIDNNSAGADFDIGSNPGNEYNPYLNKGLSDFDATHRIAITYVYNLPGPHNGWMKYVAGGWVLSGLFQWQTGYPFSVFLNNIGTSLLGDAGRANVIPGCQAVNSGNVNEYLNPACFSSTPVLTGGQTFGPTSPTGAPGNQIYTISPGGIGQIPGTSGRNIFRGPAEQRWDMGLGKKFPIHVLGEASNLEFKAEFFNLLNHPMFDIPNTTVGTPTFGQILDTINIPRQIQLALKLTF